MNRYLTFLASALVLAGAAQISVASEATLQKVGEARLNFLFWSVYDSRLFSPDGTYEPGKRPLRLELQYLLDIKAKDLVKRTGEEWDKLGLQDPRQPAWLERLTQLWPNVAKNDVLTLELDPENRSTFYRNGEQLGTIDDPDFGEQFLAIWLSPDTSRPDVRLALIGQQPAS